MFIGDVIRKYRRQIGITQEEMARRLGVTTPAVNHIGDFSQSSLYQHMTFKKMDPAFADRLRKSLIEGMRDESYAYMRGNDFWEETLKTGLDSHLRSEDTLTSE